MVNELHLQKNYIGNIQMQFISRTIRFTYILTEFQITRVISLKIKELKHTKSKPGFHIL